MVLAKAVFNEYGQRLAQAGVALDEGKIRLFRSWGVMEVEVEEAGEPTLEEIEARMAASPQLRQLSAEIDNRFYGAGPHEFLQELLRLVKKLALQEHQQE